MSRTQQKTEIANPAKARMDKDPSKSVILKESQEQDGWGTELPSSTTIDKSAYF